MAQTVAKTGVKKEKGYLYFIDKQGDVSRVPMARGGNAKKHVKEKVAKAGVQKEAGYLYFLNKEGDIGRAKLARGR